MADRPGRCRACGRNYADSLFNVDEFIKQNMVGIKYRAKAGGENDVTAAIERNRARFAAELAQRGYENCGRAGCTRAIKPAAAAEADDA